MALDRGQRYAGVPELQAEITAYQNGFATQAGNAGLAKQFVLLVKRHKAAFGTAAAAWAIITALAVWFVISVTRERNHATANERKATRNAEIAQANEQRAVVGEQEALAEKENVRRALAKSAIALAEAAYREGNGPAMQAALGDVADDLRDSTWNYLLEQSDTSIARVRTDSNDIGGVAAHPQRAGVFAVTDTTDKVVVMDVRTGTRLLEFSTKSENKGSPGNRRIAFSLDGERIAVSWARDHTMAIHSARDGKKLLEWDAPGSERLEFSPDGGRLLQVNAAKDWLAVWDAATGAQLWSYKTDKANDNVGAFTPDGGRFVTVAPLRDGRQSIQIWDANTGTFLQSLLGGSGEVRGASVHPISGELLVSGPSARAWNLTGKAERWKMASDKPADIAFWGSDDFLFCPIGSNFVCLMNLQSGIAAPPSVLWKPEPQSQRKFAVSADGRSAVLAGDSAFPIFLLRNPGAQPDQTAVTNSRYSARWLRLSPTSDRVAFIDGKDDKVTVATTP